ncbi:hypothetical protein [Gallaecimonas mangrovi]|uniref:hypothetical protein n=1 Tax=Gallaecimonas mangrovi TaxID=2291597 RepID=UPI000E1FCABC|nr:hypothetical protein [Gallaecimonas mangrovi]
MKWMKIVLFGLLLVGCSSNTTVTGTWKMPNNQVKAKNIMVFALSHELPVRQGAEDALVKKLKAAGVEAQSSLRALGAKMAPGKTTREALIAAVKAKGADHALVVALLRTDTQTRYVPGATSYSPDPFLYGPFSNVYPGLYMQISEPGYYKQFQHFYLESDLYRVKDEQLVWSAQTDTVNPDVNIDTAAQDFSDKLISAMKGAALW